jgi:hypothetical protein
MSSVSSSASSSRFFIISSLSFSMMRLRLAGGMLAQVPLSKPARAALDRRIDVGLLAGRDLGQHLAGRRIDAVEGLAAEGGGELAADERPGCGS